MPGCDMRDHPSIEFRPEQLSLPLQPLRYTAFGSNSSSADKNENNVKLHKSIGFGRKFVVESPVQDLC